MILFELDHPTLLLGVVRAEGVSAGPSDSELLARLAAAEAELRADPSRFPEPVRAAVRNVLRVGGYKPTGRGKPASEFLLGTALDQGIARIHNLVDINNLVSLGSGLPISMFDADLLGDQVSVRFGKKGEAYVFNLSGQSMDIAGLPVICRGPEREPVGNAVKDSMLCKVHPGTRRVCAVVYGTRELPLNVLEGACGELQELLGAHAAAEAVVHDLIP